MNQAPTSKVTFRERGLSPFIEIGAEPVDS